MYWPLRGRRRSWTCDPLWDVRREAHCAGISGCRRYAASQSSSLPAGRPDDRAPILWRLSPLLIRKEKDPSRVGQKKNKDKDLISSKTKPIKNKRGKREKRPYTIRWQLSQRVLAGLHDVSQNLCRHQPFHILFLALLCDCQSNPDRKIARWLVSMSWAVTKGPTTNERLGLWSPSIYIYHNMDCVQSPEQMMADTPTHRPFSFVALKKNKKGKRAGNEERESPTNVFLWIDKM